MVEKGVSEYRICLLVLPFFPIMLNLIFWKYEHFCFLSFLIRPTKLSSQVREQRWSSTERLSLALRFVWCVVTVSCMADSYVSLTGAAVGKGRICPQNDSRASGGRWGTDINTGVKHLYMKMALCLVVPPPLPPWKKKGKKKISV